MSRIKQTTDRAAAADEKLLIPYLVAGDPDLPTTALLMHDLVSRGADIIELGIPFSDPSSDGPVIQRGVERALAQGTTLQNVLHLVAEFRTRDTMTPVVLMGYLNPIEIMGYQQFVAGAAAAGVDGVLVVDLPPAEAHELNQLLRNQEIDTIFLVAPTTSASRCKDIVEMTSGYLYYVSLKGVTGAALTDYDSVQKNIEALRALTDLPIVVGFGIKDAHSARAMAELSDGVIIGSALVEKIEQLTLQEGQQELQGQGGQDAPSLQSVTAPIALIRKALNDINKDN
jgi:tryptophan synthase alpha chain